VIAMLKSLIFGACLALALAACATTPPNPAKTAAAAAAPPQGCVHDTGSRIPVKNGQCGNFGAMYTQQDLQSTGQMFADKQLGMMDPSVRVGH
jgi:hypothetical protein